MNWRAPLVVILGATGSGKTKLSLELSKRFRGEIIGADSMQVYKALDIITAKATREELETAKHHLINILEPFELFSVTDYKSHALHIIENLLTQGILPILVGGTNYYVESILWKILVDNPNSVSVNLNVYQDLTNQELHNKLKECDPLMADRLHPNNRRKILRSLEVLEQNGRRHSEILTEQQGSDGGSASGGGLRFKNALVLWLTCNQTTLDERLNKRVDEMINSGLIKELTNFHSLYKNSAANINITPDYTKGIFQSIGFKEFHNYFILDSSKRDSDEGKALFNQGVEDLKMATRRYARKQKRWIINRFLGRRDRNIPPVYGLRTDDVNKWDEDVLSPAIDIIESFMNSSTCRHERLPKQDNETSPNSLDKTYKCDICDRIFVGSYQWQMHVKSRKHRNKLCKLKQIDTI